MIAHWRHKDKLNYHSDITSDSKTYEHGLFCLNAAFLMPNFDKAGLGFALQIPEYLGLYIVKTKANAVYFIFI